MAHFVRLHAELFSGIAYWGDPEYYEAGPGHIHADDYMRGFADYIAPGADTALCGVFVRESGEHATIWLPCPENVTFASSGAVLGSVTRYTKNSVPVWDVALQPTLGFFFDNTGAIFPLDGRDVQAALAHKIPVGSYGTRKEAEDAVKDHAGPYDGSKRNMPWGR